MGETVYIMNAKTVKSSDYMYTIRYDEKKSRFLSSLKKDIVIKQSSISTPLFSCMITNPVEEYCEFSITKKVGSVVLEYLAQTVEAFYLSGNRDVVVTYDAYAFKISNIKPSAACIIASVCYDMIFNNEENLTDFVGEVLNK